MFQLLTYLYLWEASDPITVRLLQESAIVFIPIVNVDGYAYISDHFTSSGGELLEVRKNRHFDKSALAECGQIN